jgi:hypothetical protein
MQASHEGPVDLSPLTGLAIRSVEKLDTLWSFIFDDTILVGTEGPWRFIAEQRIYITSEDHLHWFGLSKPVDAADRVMSRLHGQTVQTAKYNPDTGDLIVDFAGNQYLQFLQMSCGYESWRLRINELELICTGGGRIYSCVA